MQLSEEQRRALYEAGAIYVLDDLPPASTFGMDTSAWATASKFRGVKMLPAGLHLFIASASSSSDDPELISAGIGGIRQGLLHFVRPQEVLLRKWDDAAETFRRPRKRVRVASTTEAETDLVDRDHLKSIDANLAPYPLDKLAKWHELTNLVDERCIGRVVGYDERGDAHVDALMGATGDANGSERQSERFSWDKEGAHGSSQGSQIVDELLRFADFDLKRSWRAGATGEEVTRDARDKSRLLLEIISDQFDGESTQLLAELQLAFVLFVYVHSFSSLEVYKRILSLLCSSQSALTSAATSALPLQVLGVLPAQIALLHDDAQAHELVELDAFLTAQLSALRTNLRAAKRIHETKLKEAWGRLDRISAFELGALDAEVTLRKHAVHRYDLLKNPDDSEEEDEEDKPQVVLLDEAFEAGYEEQSQHGRNLDDDEDVDIQL